MITPDDSLEQRLLQGGALRVAGIDECGRGSAGGPASVGVVVVDAATLLVDQPAGVRDSKLLSPHQRRALVEPIQSWCAGYAVGHSYPDEIDEIGINRALRAAARRALAGVGHVDVVILDGKFDWLAADTPSLFDSEGVVNPVDYPTVMQIGADRTCVSVASASVLAKVAHDDHMAELEASYPGYGWVQHNGYLTEAHRNAIRELGLSPAHRKTWKISD